MEISSSNISNPLHRATLYRLNDDGGATEKASENMPNVKVEYLEESKDAGLYLVDEEDNERILLHRIISYDIYRRESDNGIVWREPRIDDFELSLRFHDKIGCDFIWDSICRAQRNMRFNALVINMLSESGDDEFTEILQKLVDSELNSIVEFFYVGILGQLIDVITSASPPNSNSQVRPETLLRIWKKYLVLAALRFLKALVWLKDENVEDHIVRNDLFEPVVSAFVENGSKYNLLHSAILDLFEFIRMENLETLLKYLVESYWKKLVQFDHLASISKIKVKYQKSFENSEDKDERIPEKEDYFDYTNDDEKTNYIAVSNSKKPFITAVRLVDYDDDDDDDDDEEDDDHHDVNWKHRKKKTRLA